MLRDLVRTWGRARRAPPLVWMFSAERVLLSHIQTSGQDFLRTSQSSHLLRCHEQDILFGEMLSYFFLWVTSNLLVSFLEEVLSSGLHSRSKESSQVPSRSASRRWTGDGKAQRMAQLPLLRRRRLSHWPEVLEKKSPGFCARPYNPSPGSLLVPELLARTPSLPVMSWE